MPRLLTLKRDPLNLYFLFMVWEIFSVLFCGAIGPYALNPIFQATGVELYVTPAFGMLIGLLPVAPLVLAAAALGTWWAL